MSFLKVLKDNLIPVNRRIMKRELERTLVRLNEYNNIHFNRVYRKMSMPNDIWQIKDVRFFVPNYPLDYIQRIIVDSDSFYEQDILEELSEFIPKNPVICDIGANIGNHALYWLSRQNAQFVYCFEPRPETFQILEKNIKINHFDKRVKCFNLALSEKEGNLSTKFYTNENIGSNRYDEDATGDIISTSLDHLEITKKIDFMKIDVEGMEHSVLKGAKKTIQKNSPAIFIEIFDHNYEEIHAMLVDMKYKMAKKFADANYLYLPN